MTISIKVDVSLYDELLLEVLFQACGDGENTIGNRGISIYEEACDYLACQGLIRTKNCRIYEVIKNVKHKSNKKP